MTTFISSSMSFFRCLVLSEELRQWLSTFYVTSTEDKETGFVFDETESSDNKMVTSKSDEYAETDEESENEKRTGNSVDSSQWRWGERNWQRNPFYGG